MCIICNILFKNTFNLYGLNLLMRKNTKCIFNIYYKYYNLYYK